MTINPSDFTYSLPEEKIAKYPLKERDASKLLVYQKGSISHRTFRDIREHIPAHSTLFFNETRVIPARLLFYKETGAKIEIFLLEPLEPSRIMQSAMNARNKVRWSCMIGNLKKWKAGDQLQMELPNPEKNIFLTANLTDRQNMIVELSWDADVPFSEIVEAAGNIPLPPYIDRKAQESDKERYQTVYSRNEGAVAAPTAGLHFTPEIIEDLKSRDIHISNLTLHVSAGTFQPIKVANAYDHPMHSEQMLVRKDNIEAVLNAEKVISVGTTSMRTLESLYWFGVKLIDDPKAEFQVEKLSPYKKYKNSISKNDAFKAILDKMQNEGMDEILGETEIFIFPGYQFRVCDGLITNYHLPGSTLILLVAAFVGEDWKQIYDAALQNDYRFLSYGDSSLLLP